MSDRLKKEEFVRLLATRMKTDEAQPEHGLMGLLKRSMKALKLGKV